MKAFFISILISLLFLYGCANLLVPDTDESVPANRFGISGLQALISIIPVQPRVKVPMSVLFEVQNVGQSDITQGTICLHGPQEEHFEFFEECVCQPMPALEGEKEILTQQGKQKIPGEKDTVYFKGIYSPLVPGQEVLQAKLKYLYKTTATVDACVKKEVYKRDECSWLIEGVVSRNILKKVSKGPLKVARVSETLADTERGVVMSFDIDVKDTERSHGKVIDRSGDYFSCKEQEEGEIKVEMFNVPGLSQPLTCPPIKLDQFGEGKTRCEAVLKPTQNYREDARIELTYGYELNY